MRRRYRRRRRSVLVARTRSARRQRNLLLAAVVALLAGLSGSPTLALVAALMFAVPLTRRSLRLAAVRR